MDEYTLVHKEVVDLLRTVGVHYAYNQRLPCFWLRNNIDKVVEDTSIHAKLISSLDVLVQFRTQGKEPASTGEIYADV